MNPLLNGNNKHRVHVSSFLLVGQRKLQGKVSLTILLHTQAKHMNIRRRESGRLLEHRKQSMKLSYKKVVPFRAQKNNL